MENRNRKHVMDNEERLVSAKLILERHVKEFKMRRTPERMAILDMLYGDRKLYTADEVFCFLQERFRVSRTTVYNTLQLLYSLGLVIRLVDDGLVKYEACFGDKETFRTVCTRCGKMQMFEAQNVTAAFKTVKYTRFHSEQIVTCVYGICSSCISKSTRMKKRLEKESAGRKSRKDTKNNQYSKITGQ